MQPTPLRARSAGERREERGGRRRRRITVWVLDGGSAGKLRAVINKLPFFGNASRCARDENMTPAWHQNAYLHTTCAACRNGNADRSCKTIPLPFLGLGSLPRPESPRQQIERDERRTEREET